MYLFFAVLQFAYGLDNFYPLYVELRRDGNDRRPLEGTTPPSTNVPHFHIRLVLKSAALTRGF